MSGHSKWSTIKRQKQATDAARGQIFTKLANIITISVREGGSADPETNFRLRLAVEKAKQANMPKENIARALSRAAGRDSSVVQLQQVMYEGFGPGGVAIMVECVTDNINRTAAEIKNAFTTHGGNLSGVGSVAYLFSQVGELRFAKKIDYDRMLEHAITVGGEDLEETKDEFVVYTKPHDVHRVKLEFEKIGFPPAAAELTFKPTTLVTPQNSELSQKIVTLLEILEDLPDVHKVHANIEIPDTHLKSV